MSQWESKIVGISVIDPKELLDNDLNWRTHSEDQKQAMLSVLDSVGWVQDVIVNANTNTIIDGHMRVSLAVERGEQVPVVYVNLTPEEEALVLATFDNVSSMAETDQNALERLLTQVSESDLNILSQLKLIAEIPEEFALDGDDDSDSLVLEFEDNVSLSDDVMYDDNNELEEDEEIVASKTEVMPPTADRQMVLLVSPEARSTIVEAIDLVHQWIDPTMTAGDAVARAVEEFINAFRDRERD